LPYAKQWMARQSIDRFISTVNQHGNDVNAPSPSKSLSELKDECLQTRAALVPRTPAISAEGLWTQPRPQRAAASEKIRHAPDTSRSATSSTGVYTGSLTARSSSSSTSLREQMTEREIKSTSVPSTSSSKQDAEERLLEARAVLNLPGYREDKVMYYTHSIYVHIHIHSHTHTHTYVTYSLSPLVRKQRFLPILSFLSQLLKNFSASLSFLADLGHELKSEHTTCAQHARSVNFHPDHLIFFIFFSRFTHTGWRRIRA
jgi:hypothetical protein